MKRGPYRKRLTAAERMAARSVRSRNGCLEFTGSISNTGRGQFRLDGKTKNAPRIAYELANGAIPEGMVVMHTCDNGLCVDPTHLRVGSQSQNLKDMFLKGRMGTNRFKNIGRVNSWHSKFTEDDVSDIRMLRSLGMTQAAIAAEYGVTQSAISLRLTGRGRVSV